MELEFILPTLTVIFSIISIVLGRRNIARKENDNIERMESLEKELLENKSMLKEKMTEEEFQEFFDKVEATKKSVYSVRKTKQSNKQSGKIDKAVITYIVPAIAALALVGLYIYLWVTHGENPNYTTPEALNSTMSVVVGYLFGATAASNT